MVLLPLLLIWLRDPMYFNIPSRWSMVLFAVAIALFETQRTPALPLDEGPTTTQTAALPEHRWLPTYHRETPARQGSLPAEEGATDQRSRATADARGPKIFRDLSATEWRLFRC